MAFKPESYTSVSPYLIVDGAEQSIQFLEHVFGAKRLRIQLGSHGEVSHAELRIDDTVLMLGESADGWPAIPSHVHIYVPDVDATYERALAAGAIPIKAPVQEQDSDKRGGFRDAGGTTWWIGTQISDS